MVDTNDTHREEPNPRELICGIDRVLVEDFLTLIRDNFGKADKAAFFLETRTQTSSVQGLAHLRDVLSHLASMLDPRLSEVNRREQLVNAKEHFRRAIIEPYEIALNGLLFQFRDLYQNYKQRVLPIKQDYPSLKDSPSSESIEKRMDEISKLISKGREAKRVIVSNLQADNEIEALVNGYGKLSALYVEIEKYWNEFLGIEQNHQRERRKKPIKSGNTTSKFGIPDENEYISYLSQAAPRSNVISVLFLDLDNFKSVNDNHDHSVGDVVIREAIGVIQKAIDGKGELFHRSGDEMLVLLDNFNNDEACIVAERIRAEIELKEFSVIGKGVVTTTIGVSTYPVSCSDWKQLQVTADQAAMQAKKLGKNRVIHYSERLSMTPLTVLTQQNVVPDSLASSGRDPNAPPNNIEKSSIASKGSVEELAQLILGIINEGRVTTNLDKDMEKLRRIHKIERELAELKAEFDVQE